MSVEALHNEVYVLHRSLDAVELCVPVEWTVGRAVAAAHALYPDVLWEARGQGFSLCHPSRPNFKHITINKAKVKP